MAENDEPTANNAVVNNAALTNMLNPYYTHPNENPGVAIVSQVLNGGNYHSWSRAMLLALKTKKKVKFVDGSLPHPALDAPNFTIWDHCNTLVVSWLHHSLDPEVLQTITWMENASDIWNTLKKCYYQGDVFRISDLQEEIYLLKQGDATITNYFTKLKGLIQELDNFRPIPPCTCAVVCSCQLIPIVKSYREGDYVIRFLRGLNEQYSTIRSNIMMMDPLLDLDKVFSILIQQERQLVLQFDDSRVLAELDTNNGTYGRGRGRGRPNLWWPR